MTHSKAADLPAAAPDRTDMVGSLAVLLAAACWGTSGVFVKLVAASVDINAMSLAFWRDLTTFAVLLITLALFRPSWLRIRRQDIGWLAAMGAGRR